MIRLSCYPLATSFFAVTSSLMSGPPGYNYDEAKVPPYTLPDILTDSSGGKVTAESWKEKRRAEVLALLEAEQYGKAPPLPKAVKSKVSLPPTPVLGGKAIRKQVFVSFTDEESGPGMQVLIYLPADAKGPVPLFWGLNFQGNHAVEADPAIPLTPGWVPNDKDSDIKDNKANEKSRGGESSRFPLEWPISQGYGVATAHYGDIDPDFHDEFKNGVHALFPEVEAKRDGTTWGSIAAWAWGLRLGMNYFETDPAIDAKKVIVMGHSRLGKTSLWAGALDERFAIVISNNSGAGGAALAKRIFGETVARLNSSFPHWFCANFRKYNDKEADLPFDQHWLIATIAPRPVLICSATEDDWADPKGEFLSGFHASPLYKLLGTDGMAAAEMPEPDKLIDSTIGYHLRTGKHDVTLEDWRAYVAFANKHLKKR